MTSPAPRPEPDDQARSPVGPMTFEEYLAFEEASEVRHEFVRGYAYPMDVEGMRGGTFAHDAIIRNVTTQLHLGTRRSPCRTHGQSFKLLTPSGDAYYPDVTVSCGPKPPNDAVHFADPCLAVEVLSPGTSRTDVGEKYEGYVEVPSLGAYLIIESTWRAVHRHWRGDDGLWRTELVVGAGAVLLPCPAGGVLTLDEIYEDVELPDDSPSRARLRRVKEGEPDAYAAAGPD